MAGTGGRKCKCCHKLFRPDARNRHHKRYCASPSSTRSSASAVPSNGMFTALLELRESQRQQTKAQAESAGAGVM